MLGDLNLQFLLYPGNGVGFGEKEYLRKKEARDLHFSFIRRGLESQ